MHTLSSKLRRIKLHRHSVGSPRPAGWLRWLFAWRSIRADKKAAFLLDMGPRRSRFGPGFLSGSDHDDPWQRFEDRQGAEHRRRILFRVGIVVFLLAFFTWAVMESLDAISVY